MAGKKKTVLFVTSSRSDFASIESLLSMVRKDSVLKPFLFVTGDHYSKKAGETYRHIVKKGVSIDAQYRIQSTDSAVQVGEVVRATASLIKKNNISYAVVCGDRKETFAAAVACALAGVPLFHIHGGDVTYGMIDDAMRHAITKLSAIHFPASLRSAKRIRQMGEEVWRIHMTGSPDTDGLHSTLPERTAMQEAGVTKKAYALLLVNPETLLGDNGNMHMVQEILRALDAQYKEKVIVLYPNNDAFAQVIRSVYGATKKEHFVLYQQGLPRQTYLALLKNAAFLIGNSSSGITEAASFNTPVINVGQRQDGRERNKNVIDAPALEKYIRKAIQKACSRSFAVSLKGMHNVYGKGGSSKRMYRVLRATIKKHSVQKLLYKKFQFI